MNTKTICFMIVLVIMLTVPAEAKPVVIGFGEQSNLTMIETYGITDYTVYKDINAISADIPEAAYYKLKKDRNVRYIEDDAAVHISKKTSQPAQEADWGIYSINAPAAWYNSTGEGIKIAVIDTGISKKHPDLNVAGGVNLINSSNIRKWDDDNGHGTHVAGIIGACNNSIGVVGVAYDSELYAVKVLDSTGNGQISDVIEGIEWAVENDMDIISMSIGTTAYSEALEDACDFAYDSGVLVIAAAGNSGDGNSSTNNVEYPAKFDSVIAVGAVDSNNLLPSWSSDGEEVELAAPGVNIYSTYIGDSYVYSSGTSMAAPFVSGVAALIKSQNPSLNASEIRNIMDLNALDLGDQGKDSDFGFGLVQAA